MIENPEDKRLASYMQALAHCHQEMTVGIGVPVEEYQRVSATIEQQFIFVMFCFLVMTENAA